MKKVQLSNVIILVTVASFFIYTVLAIDINLRFNVIHHHAFDFKNDTLKNDNILAVYFEGDGRNMFYLDNHQMIDPLVYTGYVPLSKGLQRYKYLIVDKDKQHIIDEEPFFRGPINNNNNTHKTVSPYEFYGRLVTKQQLPLSFTRFSSHSLSSGAHVKELKSREFVHPSDEIPTFHIRTKYPEDMAQLHNHILEEVRIFANLTRITSNTIETYDKVELELSGQTSRLFKKLSYSIYINSDNDTTSLNGYRRFKLRSCVTDPSFLREKLYYDLLDATHVPTAKASFVRLFINSEPQGLYLLVDHYKAPFLQNVFGNDQQGTLIQGSMQENPLATSKILQRGANLGYFGPSKKNYFDLKTQSGPYKIQQKASDNELDGFISFIKFINSKKNRTNDYLLAQEWNKRFDVSLFLKHMVFEIILGHSDGYLGAAHNYMLYEDPAQEGRFIWFSSDLDQTIGNTLKSNRQGRKNLTAFERLDRYGIFKPSNHRPLITEIFKIRVFKDEFFKYLSDIYHAFFKTNAIIDHIHYLKTLIKVDANWDKQLDRHRANYFETNQATYNAMLFEKVLQLPLGQDFMDRIENHSIDFNAAIEGPIEGHPSIIPLLQWFKEVDTLLNLVILDGI
ncbi:coth protein-domain-containing protein [Cokeromyces recurvatus]|uniref:coth protein-domain-containing protein n=1 Tax=Cokeromyces recurvatus TaxID=90255 RepID=UPI00221F7624|nr:coth protein-domain-containing protein [Cokeromyces recurvatus]KAI7901052.1 coth protein-domain-containing protein [Cokeromyces recurvatus]